MFGHNLFFIFSHLNSLIHNVLTQLRQKGKDNEKLRSDSTKKLLARFSSNCDKNFYFYFYLN